ncbi:hypothetical protein ES703_69724 [subsurface metagenome]
MRFLVEGGNAVNRHLHLVAADSGVSHRVQNADVRANPADNHLIRLQLFQLLLKRGAKKRAVGLFGDYLALIFGQLGDDLGLGRALDGVGGKHAELGVIGGVMVAEEEHGGAFGNFPLQQALNIGDDATGALPTIERITLFQESS